MVGTGSAMRGMVIGLGSIGRRHLQNLLRLRPQLSMILVRRKESDPLDTGGDVRVVHDVASAIALAPHFAVLATPSHMHAEALRPLLRAGIPCYVEKPVVASDAQARELASLLDALKATPTTQVGCNLRFLPSLQKLRAIVTGGTIGAIVRANLVAGQWLADWRRDEDYRKSYSARGEGGGVILDLIHEIDQARWLFGEFDRVQAMAGKLSSLEIESEDVACLLLAGHGRPLVAISLDYVSRRMVRRYEVVGDNGTAIWDLGAKTLEVLRAEGIERIDCGRDAFDVGATYVSALNEFLEAIEGKCAGTSQDIRDGMKSTRLALDARAAARR